jgi:hypothetical protein
MPSICDTIITGVLKHLFIEPPSTTAAQKQKQSRSAIFVVVRQRTASDNVWAYKFECLSRFKFLCRGFEKRGRWAWLYVC